MCPVLRSRCYCVGFFLRKPRDVSLLAKEQSLSTEKPRRIAYNVQPFSQKWSALIPTRMFVVCLICSENLHVFFHSGHAEFACDQRTLLISNLVYGIDAYEILTDPITLRNQQSYWFAIRNNVPLQVTSAMQGSWVITGSDDGLVRIFGQRSGDIIQCLRHGDSKSVLHASLLVLIIIFSSWYTSANGRCEYVVPIVFICVQYDVQARSDGGNCTIVSASSGPGPSDIKVWSHSAVRFLCFTYWHWLTCIAERSLQDCQVLCKIWLENNHDHCTGGGSPIP